MAIEIDRHGDILILRLRNGSANLLSVSNGMAQSLGEALARAQADGACRAIVIAGSGKIFCGGANLADLDKAEPLHALFMAIERSAKPVVVAMHGMVLGGGLELALAGHLRIAARGTRLALPEVTLGLLPALGGTQRLPRLIGAGPALDMMLSGTTIDAEAAAALGLVDLVADGDVVDAALHLLNDGNAAFRRSGDLPCPPDLAEVVATRRQEASSSLNPAPGYILDSVAAISADFVTGLHREAELFEILARTPESRGLRDAFLRRKRVMHVRNLPAASTSPPGL